MPCSLPKAIFDLLLALLVVMTLTGGLEPISAMAGPLVVEKNLFAPDRKPVFVTLALEDGEGFELDGILILGSARPSAVVRMGAKGKPGMGGSGQDPNRPRPGARPGFGAKDPNSPFVVVHEGESVSGFRVVKIQPQGLILERDGLTYTLRVHQPLKPGPGVGPTLSSDLAATIEPSAQAQEAQAP